LKMFGMISVLFFAPIARAETNLYQLYEQLHQNPELSFQEEKTTERMARELKKAGAEVTERWGGFGVVGLLKNGKGPVLMIRADADGLPVLEETGKAFASRVTQKDKEGRVVPVMHACGHDVHMTVLLGTLHELQKKRDQWQGTVVFVVQPAEERGQGALNMLKAGLFEKFPRPDYNVALHVSADLPAGRVAYTPGYAFANVDTVDIKVFGEGGHGAAPHRTKDPIVLASQLVLALQTIISREIAPNNPAVLTVGSIHGGAQHNVIPNEVQLQLTVRSYAPEVRTQILDAIKRISRGLGLAAGLPEQKLPQVSILETYTPSVYNDPALTERFAATLGRTLGSAQVEKVPPVMVGEDFGQYGLVQPRIPGLIYWLGSVNGTAFQEATRQGKSLPTLHSSTYIPDAKPTIDTGVKAMTAVALDLLQITSRKD
jgi:amidohydrolase